MNREIKFRAQSLTLDHRWIYGSYIYKPKENYHQIFEWENGFDVAVDKNTVGQYTGLKDKNGKEIYEGDIVLLEDTYKTPITDDGQGPTDDCNHLSPIIFSNGSFGLDIQESADYYDKGFTPFSTIEGAEYFEVIGNIYENPELLEPTKAAS